MAKKDLLYDHPLIFILLIYLFVTIIMWDFYVELVDYIDPFNKENTFIWIHGALFMTMFAWEFRARGISIRRPVLVSCFGIVMHSLLYWISFKVSGADKLVFQRGAPLVMVAITYLFYLFAFNLVWHAFGELARYKSKIRKVLEAGVSARAYVEETWDTGTRLSQTFRKFYWLKLRLRITGHLSADYTVTDFFWVSEFHIHRMTRKKDPLPVKVDRKNPKKVAIDLPWTQEDDDDAGLHRLE